MIKQGLAALVATMAIGTTAFAEDEGFSIDGYVGGVTDYRDRGLSLSGKDPAVVASVGAYQDNGFYFGVSGASVGWAGIDARVRGFAGYRIDKGDYIYDFSAELDSTHGDDSNFYPEFRGTIARDFGLAFIRGGLVYAPDGRWSLPTQQSLYAFTDLEVPVPNLPELTIIGRLGYDMRGGDFRNLWDYGIGLSAFIESVELTLMYENSSLNGGYGKGAVVFGAKYYF
ncbi:MAG: hypothetical protein EP335_08655 [Alphaproteobacteria bacterium]|nr:MAG: hypothetical protein EP335_08655 [Alphaproteobacteria bacterium]